MNKSLFFISVQIGLKTSPSHWLTLDVQGVVGQTNVVAVDDIDIYEGLCKANTSYFLCNNGNKIPMSEVNID